MLLSLVILGGSLVLNFLLFKRAKQYYVELNGTRLDPVGLNHYPTSTQSKSSQALIRVVLFGDSRSAAWPAPGLSDSPEKQYEFINRGIGSQTSIQTLQRFSQHVQPLEPDVVLIQVGVNDLKTVALFPEQADSIIAACKKNIQHIVTTTQKTGAIAIVTTVFPVGEVPWERQLFWSEDISLAVQSVNAYIKTLASDRVLIFDAFSLLANEQQLLRPEYRIDELHLNAAGYTKLNQELTLLLTKLSTKTTPASRKSVINQN